MVDPEKVSRRQFFDRARDAAALVVVSAASASMGMLGGFALERERSTAGPGIVGLVIKNQNNEFSPVANIRVVLYIAEKDPSLMPRQIAMVTDTDRFGLYHFSEVSAGKYIVSIQSGGSPPELKEQKHVNSALVEISESTRGVLAGPTLINVA